MSNHENEFMSLQARIDAAEHAGEPIVELVKEQIKLLERSHDEFISRALAEGYSLSDFRVGKIEIDQYSAMRQLAEKVGLPVERYDTMIRRVRVRVFGEENTRRFFDTQGM